MAKGASRIGIMAGAAIVAWGAVATGLVVSVKSNPPTDVAAAVPADDFGDRVKDYLIANPEIMLEVQDSLERKQREARNVRASAAILDNQAALFDSEHDLALGNPEGDVTIVEFFDYNCGYCKHALDDMDQVIGADSNVRFVLKEFPILGEDSAAAHRVSYAVRSLAPEKYGDFHRALLGGQGRATEASALAVAASLGLSEEEVRAEMQRNPNESQVREAYRLATSLGITGTPSYVVGNEALFGALGADVLEKKVASVRDCGSTTC